MRVGLIAKPLLYGFLSYGPLKGKESVSPGMGRLMGTSCVLPKGPGFLLFCSLVHSHPRIPKEFFQLRKTLTLGWTRWLGMAWWVKVPAAKRDDQQSVPGTYMVEGEN